jgi:hypothetical protein
LAPAERPTPQPSEPDAPPVARRVPAAAPCSCPPAAHPTPPTPTTALLSPPAARHPLRPQIRCSLLDGAPATMDGDGDLPHDFFSQTASSGAAVHPIDGDGWGMSPPRLRGSASRGSAPGGLGRASVDGGLSAPRIGLENLDLNTDCAAASYPNLNMYTPPSSGERVRPWYAPQRTRSDGVPQRAGRPPRQGLPPPPREGPRSSWQGRREVGARRC